MNLHGPGARAKDNLTTIIQIAKLHGISVFAHIRDQLGRRFEFPSLAAAIETAAYLPSKHLAGNCEGT